MKRFSRLSLPAAVLTAAAVFLFPSLSAFASETGSDDQLPAESQAEAENAPSDSGSDYGNSASIFLDTLVSAFPARTNEEGSRSQSVADAGAWIQSQLESFGYTVTASDYTHYNYTGINYSVTKPGNSDQVICIGAHYDSEATEGADDNGSGVSVLLELAQRFAAAQTPCTLQFVFFDGEENGGYVGSCNYINRVMIPDGSLEKTLCYINIDSVGAGDRLFAYGGIYDGDTLTQTWPLQTALASAELAGIDLYTLPDEVADYTVDEELAFRSPTRVTGSDQHYFVQNGIPYVYFEASRWCEADGTGPDDTVLTCHYETDNEAFASTGGQIMHTEFDRLATLNEALPGRIQSNMSSVSEIVTSMLLEISPSTADDLADIPYQASLPEGYTAANADDPAASESDPANAHGNDSAASESGDSASESNSAADPSQNPDDASQNPDNASQAAGDSASTGSGSDGTGSIADAGQSGSTGSSQTILPSNHSLIIIIFSFSAAVIVLCVGFVIYTTAASTRQRRRSRRFNRNRKKKKNRFE